MLSKEQFQELYTLIDTEQLTVCNDVENEVWNSICLLYTSPSPRDRTRSRMPSSA